MKHRIFYPLVGIACVLALAGCPAKPTKDTELRAVLKPWFEKEHEWHSKLFTAVCQLEEKAGIEVEKRLCPGGPSEQGGRPPAPPEFE